MKDSIEQRLKGYMAQGLSQYEAYQKAVRDEEDEDPSLLDRARAGIRGLPGYDTARDVAMGVTEGATQLAGYVTDRARDPVGTLRGIGEAYGQFEAGVGDVGMTAAAGIAETAGMDAEPIREARDEYVDENYGAPQTGAQTAARMAGTVAPYMALPGMAYGRAGLRGAAAADIGLDYLTAAGDEEYSLAGMAEGIDPEAEGFQGGVRRTAESLTSPLGGLEETAESPVKRGLAEAVPFTALAYGPDAAVRGYGRLRGMGESGAAPNLARGGSEAARVPGEVESGMQGRWYSRARKAVEEAPQETATAEQWQGMLRKAKEGVSESEREWSGLDQFLESRAGQKITRDELLEQVGPGIGLTEKRVGGMQGPYAGRSTEELMEMQADAERRAQLAQRAGNQEEANRLFTESEEITRAVEELELGGAGTSKFEKWKQPGGENYREVRIGVEGEDYVPNPAHDDIPGEVSRLRMTDRTVDGERTLFIEEIQSDWHQKGRSQGYRREPPESVRQVMDEVRQAQDALQESESRLAYQRGSPLEADVLEEVQKRKTAFNEANARLREASRAAGFEPSGPSAVPDAPLKGTDEWVGLSFRRALQEAAEGGYDRVAWVSGEQAADLYDLRHQVSRIEWGEGSGTLRAYDHDDQLVMDREGVSADDLPDYVGKDPAQRLVESDPGARRTITDDDLRRYRESYESDLTDEQRDLLRNVHDAVGSGEDFRDVRSKVSSSEREFLDEVEFDLTSGSMSGGRGGFRSIEGDDLAVGGEGMDEFYNRIVPKAVQKEAKRLGVEIEPVRVETSPVGPSDSDAARRLREVWPELDLDDTRQLQEYRAEARRAGDEDSVSDIDAVLHGTEAREAPEFREGGTEPTNLSIRLTPEARDKILNEGTRLGAATPEAVRTISGAGTGAAVGAAADEESPGRGALIGGVAGAGSANAPAAIRGLDVGDEARTGIRGYSDLAGQERRISRETRELRTDDDIFGEAQRRVTLGQDRRMRQRPFEGPDRRDARDLPGARVGGELNEIRGMEQRQPPESPIYRASDAPEGRYWTPQRESALAYRHNPPFGGSNVYQADAGGLRTLDLTEPGDHEAFLREVLGEDWQDRHQTSAWALEDPEVVRALEEGGYDAVRFLDDYPNESTSVFVPGGMTGDAVNVGEREGLIEALEGNSRWQAGALFDEAREWAASRSVRDDGARVRPDDLDDDMVLDLIRNGQADDGDFVIRLNDQGERSSGMTDPRAGFGTPDIARSLAGGTTGSAVGAASAEEGESPIARGIVGFGAGAAAGAAAGPATRRMVEGRADDALPSTGLREADAPPLITPSQRALEAADEVNIRNFNLDIEGEERVRRHIGRIMETGRESDLGQRTVTWDETRRVANELGLDPGELDKTAASRMTGAELLAVRDIVAQNIDDMTRIEKRLRTGVSETGMPLTIGDREQAQRLVNSLTSQNEKMLRKFVKSRSEMGRNLNSLKILANRSLDPVAWTAKAEKVKGVPLSEFEGRELRRLLAKGERAELVKYVGSLYDAPLPEKLVTLWKAGLLSNPATHQGNIVGNFTMATLEGMKDAPAALFDRVAASVSDVQAKDGVSLDAVKAGWDAVDPEATRNVARILVEPTAGAAIGGATGSAVSDEDSPLPWVAGAAGGLAGFGHALSRVPGQLDDAAMLAKYDIHRQVDYDEWGKLSPFLNAYAGPNSRIFSSLTEGDKVFKNFAMGRSLTEQARVIARNEGLEGPEFAQRVNELIETDAELHMRAIADAEVSTFLNKGGHTTFRGIDLAEAGEGLRRSLGSAGHVVIPFTRTPANIMDRVLEYSPVGFLADLPKAAEWMQKIRQGEKAGGLNGQDLAELMQLQKEMVEQAGRATVGTTAMLIGYTLADQGILTGNYPSSDATERNIQDITREQPHSIKVGDEWLGLDRLSPLGNLMTIGAEVHSMAQDSEVGLAGGVKALPAVMGKTVVDQSFLRGVQGALDAISNPERSFARWARSTVASAVPSGIYGVTRAVDPTIRDPQSVPSAIQGRLPGLSTGVTPTIDAFGEERQRSTSAVGRLGTVASPFMWRESREDDPVRSEVARVGASISRYSPRGVDRGTPEYEALQREYGQASEEAVREVIESSAYRNPNREVSDLRRLPENEGVSDEELEDMARKEMIEDAVRNARADLTRQRSRRR